jgi:hypothetical protein
MCGMPPDWPIMFAALAYRCHWQPSEIDKLTLRELRWWYGHIVDLSNKV